MSKILPEHLGIIMDGNRRWARERAKDPMAGHDAGAEILKKIAIASAQRNIKFISVYAFSKENWARTQKEIGFLMNQIVNLPARHLDDIHRAGIKVLFLGSRKELKGNVIKSIEQSEAKTKNNRKATLGICFNYGGQQEIVDAAKKLLEKGASPDKVDEKSFAKLLYEPALPPIDLIVRTSGEQRLSGFMLWRAAYSELYFSEKYWPDFTEADLDSALEEYARRQRRYGK